MVHIRVDINKREMRQVQRHLLNVGRRAQITRPVLEDLKRPLGRSWTENLFSGGALFGPWPPLKPATVAEKIAMGAPAIFIRSGRLLKSLSLVGGDNRIILGPDWAFYGTTVEYAQPLHYGWDSSEAMGHSGGSRLPSHLVGMTPATRLNLMRQIGNFVVLGKKGEII